MPLRRVGFSRRCVGEGRGIPTDGPGSWPEGRAVNDSFHPRPVGIAKKYFCVRPKTGPGKNFQNFDPEPFQIFAPGRNL
jgi:hypothetical protein